jgi:hypothetical protein
MFNYFLFIKNLFSEFFKKFVIFLNKKINSINYLNVDY